MSLLSASQVQQAITYAKQRYNVRSNRIFQLSFGTEADGDFGEQIAQAIALFQKENDFPANQIDGKPGAKTIDALMKRSPIKTTTSTTPEANVRALRAAEYVHLVADLNNLPVQQALTVRLCESSNKMVQTQFETGKNPVVCLGFSAFVSHNTLLDAIQAGLKEVAPSSNVSPQPDLLTTMQQSSAIKHNKSKLKDLRAIRIVQELVKANPDGEIGVGTVERLAQFQDSKGLEPTGKLDLNTLQAFYEILIDRKHFNAIIYLLTDFFDLDEHFSVGLGLLEMSLDDVLDFSDHVGASGITLTWADVVRRSCSIIRIRSSIFNGNLDKVSRVLVHELTHMQNNYKPRSEFVIKKVEDKGFSVEMEFLAHSQELIHSGLPRSEDVILFGIAKTIITGYWEDMSTKQKQFYWSRFEAIRAIVHKQFATLPNSIEPQQKAFFQDVVTLYNNQQKP